MSIARDPRDRKKHFECFDYRRKERQAMLKRGERWLTHDDITQAGDSYYIGPDEWFRFDDPKKNSGIIGTPIPLDVFCYTPKGRALRLKRPVLTTTP